VCYGDQPDFIKPLFMRFCKTAKSAKNYMPSKHCEEIMSKLFPDATLSHFEAFNTYGMDGPISCLK